MKEVEEKIEKKLSQVKFKKKFIAGLDPLDVWKKIEDLNKDYQLLFQLQEEAYRAKLEAIKEYYSSGGIDGKI